MVGISVVAAGVYVWPQFLIQQAGTNGIYTLIAITGLAMGLAALEVALALNLREPTFLSGLRKMLPFIGVGFVFPLWVVVHIAADGIILTLYGMMIRTNFYPNTPRLPMDIAILAAAIWIAGRPLASVARQVQFWFPIILILLFVVVGFGARNLDYWSPLLPSRNFLVIPWVKTIMGTWFLFSNAAVVATLTPHVRWRRPRDAYVAAMAAMGGQGMVLLMLYAIGLVTLGPDGLSRIYWPLVYVFSLISVQTFFLKGIGSFVIMVWTSTTVLYMAVHLFCFNWNVMSLSKNPPVWWRGVVFAGSAAILLAFTLWIPSTIAAAGILFAVVSPATLAWRLVFLPPLWLLSFRYRSQQRWEGMP